MQIFATHNEIYKKNQHFCINILMTFSYIFRCQSISFAKQLGKNNILIHFKLKSKIY